MNEILIKKAYGYWKELTEANNACNANPMINGKELHGYIALKAKFDAIMELVYEMKLTEELVEYINKAEGKEVYSYFHVVA